MMKKTKKRVNIKLRNESAGKEKSKIESFVTIFQRKIDTGGKKTHHAISWRWSVWLVEKTATIKLLVRSRKRYHDREMFIKIFTMLPIQAKHNYRDARRELIEATVVKRNGEKHHFFFHCLCSVIFGS